MAITFKSGNVFSCTTNIFIRPRFWKPRLSDTFLFTAFFVIWNITNTNAVRIGFNNIIFDSVFIK